MQSGCAWSIDICVWSIERLYSFQDICLEHRICVWGIESVIGVQSICLEQQMRVWSTACVRLVDRQKMSSEPHYTSFSSVYELYRSMRASVRSIEYVFYPPKSV